MVAFKFAYALMFSFNRTFGQDFVVVDLETTGLSGARDEIVEIGAVLSRNFVPVKTFRTLIRPREPIPAEVTAIHGITNAMVRDAPRIEEALPEFERFIGERTLIAHNARFDLSFLQTAYQRVLGKRFQNSCMDTLALSRANFDLPSHSLSALVRALGIELLAAVEPLDVGGEQLLEFGLRLAGESDHHRGADRQVRQPFSEPGTTGLLPVLPESGA